MKDSCNPVSNITTSHPFTANRLTDSFIIPFFRITFGTATIFLLLINAQIKASGIHEYRHSPINYLKTPAVISNFQQPDCAVIEAIPLSKHTYESPGYEKSGITAWIGLTARNLDDANEQESYIIFNPEATTGFDLLFDAEFIPGSGPRFYSIAGNEQLSTNSIPSITSETEINFVFLPNQGSNFEIEASGLDLIESPVFLYDRQTRADLNLSLNPLYSFVSLPGDDTARFVLHFVLTGIQNPKDCKEFKAYYYDQALHINSLSSNDIVTVFDIHGKQLKQINCQAKEKLTYPIVLSPGVYLLHLISGKEILSKKIMVY